MEIQPSPFTPRHPLLQKHLQYFYFLKTDSSQFETQYYAFPSINTVLNIHQKANCHIQDYHTHVFENSNQPHLAIVQGMRELPLRAHLQGRLDKVTIIFEPLGFNHFLPVSYVEVAPKDSQVFTAWDGLPEYHHFLQAFYATQDHTQRTLLLEDFLLSVYRPFPEYEVLQQALSLLRQFDQELPVEEIALRLKLHPRTFHRLFKKHMGISPVGYRKVARFRHSLNNKLVDAQFKKLTELGYASNFYDQAYFNKVYKQFTGSNPSTFFNSIDTMAEDKLIFQFLKEKDSSV